MTPEQAITFIDRVYQLVETPDMTAPLTRWVDLAAGELGAMMVASKSPDGTPYKPLAQKRPKGHNQKSGPLIDLGELLASIIGAGDGHIEQVTPNSAKIGTSHTKQTKHGAVPVATIHQHGTERIPARPFIGANDEILDAAQELVADALINQVGHASAA